MATYDNPRHEVVHWISHATFRPTRTACHFLDSSMPSWDWENCDLVGEPRDVNCRKCRNTAEYLDASQAAFDQERGLT